MVLLWNVQSIIIGFIFGLGVGIGFFFIAGDLITEARENDPDNVFTNSIFFDFLMKYFCPAIIVISLTFMLGPLFVGGYSYLKEQEIIFNLDPKLVYIVGVLIITLLLDVIIIVTKISYPEYRIYSNIWMFITLGILPIFLI